MAEDESVQVIPPNATLAQREEDYGPYGEGMTRDAALWTAYLAPRLKGALSARDVAWMLVLVKARRDTYAPKVDNLDDALGYLYGMRRGGRF